MEANNDHEEETLRFNFKELLDQQKILECQFNHLSLQRSDIVKLLPDLTRKRLSALKKLQIDYLNVEAKFYEDIHKVACKFQERIQVISDKRCAIVNGEYTPNNDTDLFENDQDLDSATSVPDPQESTPYYTVKKKITLPVKINHKGKLVSDNSLEMFTGTINMVNWAYETSSFKDNGIPDFWVTVLKCGKLTGELVQAQDEPILKHLINIKVVMLEKDPLGFTLEFVFKPNEYFSNEILTKTYYLKFEVDKEDPFSYEGPEIYKSKGCTINWFVGKNATVKTIKKRQKHKNAPMTRIVTKSVKVSSFFNFFSPPKMPADSEFVDEKQGEEMDYDFEIGHYLKERLVPRAVLYFTGEGIEEESSFEESEEETETDDEEEEETPAAFAKQGN